MLCKSQLTVKHELHDHLVQAITLDLLYWQTWRDARLSVPQGIGSLTLDSSWKNKIWIPNLYFANSAQAKPVDIKSGSLFLEMNEDAIFLMSTRVIVKLACQMDLFSFPQDTQTCTIDLACGKLIVTIINRPNHLLYQLVDWNNQSVNFVWQSFVLQDMDDFPKYEITDYRITDCISMRGPDFACLSVQLRLFRRFSYYAIRIYGPSILLVLTSFVGFWIPVVGYPARVRSIIKSNNYHINFHLFPDCLNCHPIIVINYPTNSNKCRNQCFLCGCIAHLDDGFNFFRIHGFN